MIQLGYPYPKRKEQLGKLFLLGAPRTYDVPFQNQLRTYPVHRVPIALPKYRLSNGRTLAAQAEYLATHPEVPKDFFSRDLELEEAQVVQHGFLRSLAEEKDLIGYFKKHKQEEPLILSHDGFVVNGNRRLCAMRMLLEGEPNAYQHFEHIDVVILPPADEKDIDALEAQLQIHRDIKADYSWTSQAFMLKKRKDEHRYSDDDLSRLYEIKTSEINELLEMLNYADQYLESRGKPGHYHLIEETKYAFAQLRKVRSAKGFKTEGERTLFEQVAFTLIDKPEDGRLYESIPQAGKYLPKIVSQIRIEFPSNASPAGNGNPLLGGIGDPLLDVISVVEEPKNLEKIRAIVTDVVAAETAKDKERKRGDFVLLSVRKANSALIDAVNGITEATDKAGVGTQISEIEKSLKVLREWLDGDVKN